MKPSNNTVPGILGESNKTITLHSNEDYLTHTISLIKQAKRTIKIYSFDLPQVIFSSMAVTSALSEFVRKNRQVNLEILLNDTRLLIQKRPPLLNLNSRLSAIKIKKAHQDYCFGEQTLLLFDTTAIVKKPDINSQIGTVCYNDKANVRALSLTFNEFWERSSDDPNLREQLI